MARRWRGVAIVCQHVRRGLIAGLLVGGLGLACTAAAPSAANPPPAATATAGKNARAAATASPSPGTTPSPLARPSPATVRVGLPGAVSDACVLVAAEKGYMH